MNKRLTISTGVGVLAWAALLSLGYVSCAKKPAPVAKKVEVPVMQEQKPTCVPYEVVVREPDSRGHHDTFWDIAGREWGGRTYLYPALQEANPGITDPTKLMVSEVVLIPCLCDLVKKPLVKKTAVSKKVKVVPVVATPCPTCPPVCPTCPSENAKISAVPTPAPSADKGVVSPTEAPNPPPAPTAPQAVSLVPLTPTGFWAGPGNCGTGQINLSWNLTLEANVYKILRDGVLVHTTDSLVWADTGLEAGKWYVYTIAGSNSAGDSLFGVTVPAVTKAPVVCATVVPPVPEHPSYHEDATIVPPEIPSYHEDIVPSKSPTAVRPPTTQGTPVTSDSKTYPKNAVTSDKTPGSLWNVLQTSPVERGNWIDYFHVDQGYVLGKFGKIQVGPYVAFNAAKDTDGRSWNNKLEGEVGFKATRLFSGGIVQVGGAYAVERRFFPGGFPDMPTFATWPPPGATCQSCSPGHPSRVLNQTRSGFIGFWEGWHGWQQPTGIPSGRTFLPGTFPGTVQYRVGNISPFERNNLIGVAKVEQGFTLAQFNRFSFIPTAVFQAGYDTDGNAWNRRSLYGGVMKIRFPLWKSSAFVVEGGYMCAKQYSGTSAYGTSGCGPAFGVTLWTGWGRKY